MPFNVGGYLYNSIESFYNQDYRNIVSNGLILQLDTNVNESYPGSGSTWYDISGFDNHFTIQGNVTYDAINGFGNFDGNGSGNGNKIYRSGFGRNLKTSQGGDGYTVMVYCRSTGGSPAWRKVIGNSDGDNYIDLYQSASSPYGWHQDGSGETLYVNGTAVTQDLSVMPGAGYNLYIATNSNSGGLNNPNGDLTIGNEPNVGSGTNAYPWIGYISVVLVYNRVLSTTEMTQNYTALKSRYEKYYNCGYGCTLYNYNPGCTPC
jgi:hypothetical protein